MKAGCIKGIGLVMSLILLWGCSGCYDSAQIETRAVVLAIAIDDLEQQTTDWEKETESIKKVPDRFTVTFELPKFTQEQQQPSPAEGKDLFWMLTTRGASVIEAIRNADLRSEKTLTFGHLKILAVSEAMARKGLYPLLDFFHREPIVPRKINIVITEGKASEVISITPHLESFYGIYQEDVLKNETNEIPRHSEELQQLFIDLGKTLYGIEHKHSGFVPYVKKIKTGDATKICGLAIIKEGKMVGKLNLYESLGLAIALNRVPEQTAFMIPNPLVKGNDFVFGSHGTHTELYFNGDEKNLSFTYKINIEGDLIEYPCEIQMANKEKNLPVLEKATEKHLENEVQQTIRRLQTYNVDLLGLDEHLYQKHPAVWKKAAGNWNDLFPKADVDIQVNVNIRRVGTKK